MLHCIIILNSIYLSPVFVYQTNIIQCWILHKSEQKIPKNITYISGIIKTQLRQ